VYRIHGLEPGKYWVRSAEYTLDDGTGLLPTFGPESRASREARVQDARLDTDTLDADVRPEMGVLFHLGGVLDCSPTGAPVNVSLSSETGKRTTQAGCGSSYAFQGLAPALYEVLAEKIGGTDAGYIELFFLMCAAPAHLAGAEFPSPLQVIGAIFRIAGPSARSSCRETASHLDTGR